MFIVDKGLKKLIDQDILQITVDDEYPPFDPSKQIGPSTIDLRLSRIFRRYKPEVDTIDLTQEKETEIVELALDGELTIQPGELILGLTVEIIRLPANISGLTAARSSIARLGLSVGEQTLIHPGYIGSVALQLKNNTDRPIKIKPLVAICQVMFLYGTDNAENPYNDTGKYFYEVIVPQTSQIRVELDENRQTEDIPIDFAFVTALPKERDAVLKYLDTYKKVQFSFEPLTYYRGRINIPTTNDYYEVVVIMLLEMGNGEAAIASMEVIRRWRPDSVIMVGIAGGVPSKVALGDVVVANSVFYYELAKRTPKGDHRRGQYFSSDRLLYDRAISHETNDWKSKISIERPDELDADIHFPKVHFGAIASGEKILADERTLAKLLDECPDLLAVAMEGAGVARAASHQPRLTRFLEVRSICDHGNEQKNDDWQAFAAEAAAAFTISLLRSAPVPPRENSGTRIIETTSIDANDPIINNSSANPTISIQKDIPSTDLQIEEANSPQLLTNLPEQSSHLQNETDKSEVDTLMLKLNEITDPYFFKRLAQIGPNTHIQPFDQTICEFASAADLNQEKIAEFFRRYKVQIQDDFCQGDNDRSHLEHFELLQESHPTYAALLCFGTKPTKWLAGAFTRCTLWRGDDRHNGWLDVQDYQGDLINQFESSSNFLQRSLHWTRVIGRDERTEELEIPLVALQEALANALVHREYIKQTSCVYVDVFSNRVEINNPGGLPETMTLELLEEEHSSHPRNPQVARVFYLYGYVDKVGSGIQRIQRHIKNAGLPPVELKLGKDKTFRVIFYRAKLI